MSEELSTGLPDGSVVVVHEGIDHPVPYQRINGIWDDRGGSRFDSDIARMLKSGKAEIAYRHPDKAERLAEMLYERIESRLVGFGWSEASSDTRKLYLDVAADAMKEWGK